MNAPASLDRCFQFSVRKLSGSLPRGWARGCAGLRVIAQIVRSKAEGNLKGWHAWRVGFLPPAVVCLYACGMGLCLFCLPSRRVGLCGRLRRWLFLDLILVYAFPCAVCLLGAFLAVRL